MDFYNITSIKLDKKSDTTFVLSFGAESKGVDHETYNIMIQFFYKEVEFIKELISKHINGDSLGLGSRLIIKSIGNHRCDQFYSSLKLYIDKDNGLLVIEVMEYCCNANGVLLHPLFKLPCCIYFDSESEVNLFNSLLEK